LAPGTYWVTVRAVGANGAVSPSAQGAVILISVDFSALRVYPSPWRSDRDSGHDIIFDGLTTASTVKIFTVSGRWVRTLGSSDGLLSWDLKNDAGDRVASGLYLYVITNAQGRRARGKFAIIR